MKTSKTSKIKLTPAPGYVLILPQEAESKTASGIYLPDSNTEKPQKGTVIAVGGDDVTDYGTKKKAFCKAKDVVLYKKWGGNEVKIDGVEYLFVKFEDILAVETA